jgi:hypothetical protein
MIIAATLLTSAYNRYIITHNIEPDNIVYIILMIILCIGCSGILFVLHTPVTIISFTIISVTTAYFLYKENQYTSGNTDKTFNESIPQLIYIVAWLVFSFTVSTSRYAVAAALLIVFSNLYMLPVQRKKSIVDGPAYIILTIGWALMSSYISPKKN